MSHGAQYSRYLTGDRFKDTISRPWRTVACEGAFTGSHVDGGGFATWIRFRKGNKLWCCRFRDDFAEDVPSIIPHTEDANRWTLLVPQAGDSMFVSSCTIRLSPMTYS